MNDPLQTLCWDDLRIVKAIADHGNLVAAATALQVNHSTVSRRLTALETCLGVCLFDRRRSGYVATDAGSELVALAGRLELEILSVARRVSGHAQGLKGELRMTTSDALLLDFLTPIVARFQTANPQIRIEVSVGNSALNLARGESDIAFRATLAPPENLFGRKVATIAWAVYGRKPVQPLPMPQARELVGMPWVSYGKGLSGLRAFDFVEQTVAAEQVIYRSDSVAGVAAAIAAGIGVGLLPCMHGDLQPGLVRLSPVQPEVYDELWILTHPDIRKSGRVHAFMQHCAEAIIARRDFIEGCGRFD
ncbi:LysR family transcriptional regulator [Pseudomonas parafulva]|uniref:LysR family transcriptional regulator n=1 Tax=Pseudomonas TaxID=286 RepID=UPI000F7B16AA|nr:LysR family transcriptional regulator [Pseudomonas putida]RSC29474.1 LysR family transcriptional regulator [Pseudomonas putida]